MLQGIHIFIQITIDFIFVGHSFLVFSPVFQHIQHDVGRLVLVADIRRSYPICENLNLSIFSQVVDIETRQKLGPNQKGEICIKGPVIMKGYAGNKTATRDMLDNEGYLKTGDIGYYDQDGTFFIVDRLKELIKYKGSQVRIPITNDNAIIVNP